MMSNKALYAAVVIVVIIVIAAVAYKKGWLNKFMPSSWQHKSGFVGAFGRTPGMEHCLAYDGPGKRAFHFNRCTWV